MVKLSGVLPIHNEASMLRVTLPYFRNSWFRRELKRYSVVYSLDLVLRPPYILEHQLRIVKVEWVGVKA